MVFLGSSRRLEREFLSRACGKALVVPEGES